MSLTDYIKLNIDLQDLDFRLNKEENVKVQLIIFLPT